MDPQNQPYPPFFYPYYPQQGVNPQDQMQYKNKMPPMQYPPGPNPVQYMNQNPPQQPVPMNYGYYKPQDMPYPDMKGSYQEGAPFTMMPRMQMQGGPLGPQPQTQNMIKEQNSGMIQAPKEEDNQSSAEKSSSIGMTTKKRISKVKAQKPDQKAKVSMQKIETYISNLSNEEIAQKPINKDEETVFKKIFAKFSFNWKKLAKHSFHICYGEYGQKFLVDYFETIEHDPEVKNRPFTQEEDERISSLISQYGKDWVKLSKKFNERSAIMVKNRYYYLKKKGMVGASPE